jgi:hypothetical protein
MNNNNQRVRILDNKHSIISLAKFYYRNTHIALATNCILFANFNTVLEICKHNLINIFFW